MPMLLCARVACKRFECARICSWVLAAGLAVSDRWGCAQLGNRWPYVHLFCLLRRFRSSKWLDIERY